MAFELTIFVFPGCWTVGSLDERVIGLCLEYKRQFMIYLGYKKEEKFKLLIQQEQIARNRQGSTDFSS